jgi:hypothetical protein
MREWFLRDLEAWKIPGSAGVGRQVVWLGVGPFIYVHGALLEAGACLHCTATWRSSTKTAPESDAGVVSARS